MTQFPTIFLQEECEEDADYKMAPTEIYHSPCDTPDHLSDIDLLLDSEVTSFDLEKYMEHDQHKGISTKTRKQIVTVKIIELVTECFSDETCYI